MRLRAARDALCPSDAASCSLVLIVYACLVCLEAFLRLLRECWENRELYWPKGKRRRRGRVLLTFKLSCVSGRQDGPELYLVPSPTCSPALRKLHPTTTSSLLFHSWTNIYLLYCTPFPSLSRPVDIQYQLSIPTPPPHHVEHNAIPVRAITTSRTDLRCAGGRR